MRILKGRGEDPAARSLTYHGSPERRVVLKAGGNAERIRVALDLEGNGAVRNRGRDAQGPRRGR